MFDLTGKVALITGSTKGIGKSIAEEMARAGAKVVVSSRKADAVEAVTKELTAAGREAIGVPCNIGSKAELQNLVDKTMAKWGRIDILVCNAAINPHFGSITKVSDEVFDKMMGSNIRSIFWLSNMVLPQMAERKDGAMIIISSIAALRGSNVNGLYGVTKAADSPVVERRAECVCGVIHERDPPAAFPAGMLDHLLEFIHLARQAVSMDSDHNRDVLVLVEQHFQVGWIEG